MLLVAVAVLTTLQLRIRVPRRFNPRLAVLGHFATFNLRFIAKKNIYHNLSYNSSCLSDTNMTMDKTKTATTPVSGRYRALSLYARTRTARSPGSVVYTGCSRVQSDAMKNRLSPIDD
jgi:hypothetical protein